MTGTAQHAQRPVRSVADGCPRPGLLLGGWEPFRMPSYAKQHRLTGRPRVPR